MKVWYIRVLCIDGCCAEICHTSFYLIDIFLINGDQSFSHVMKFKYDIETESDIVKNPLTPPAVIMNDGQSLMNF